MQVKTLGNFQMTEGECVLNDDVLRSDMLKKLLIYILTHREHPISVQELSDALWQEDETDNPAGALKNLMYRLRNTLKKALGDYKYIITSPGAYCWNTEIEVHLDAEAFEASYEKAKKATTEEEAIQHYEEALSYYKGEFADNVLDKHWAITLSTYYHSLFLSATKSLAELYLKTGRFEDMERICTNGLKYDQVDEQLHCYHIKSLISQNNFKMAMKHYEDAVKILYDALGVRNSAQLKAVHEELLKMSKGTEAERIENVHEDMTEKEEPEGAYICGYPVFREIYRLEARKISRLGESEYVLLMTIQLKDDAAAGDNEQMKQFMIKKAMGQLEEVLVEALRIGDVAARYSDSQFVVLLPTCTYESCLMVSERILSRFYAKNKGKRIQIKTDYEEVTTSSTSLVR